MKALSGIVTSTKMEKTAVVEITFRVAHPLYKKLMTRSKKYKADTACMTVTRGDMVEISETRPVGSDKHFKITKIVKVKGENT